MIVCSCNVLSYSQIRTAVADHPQLCQEVWWGKRLAATRVDLTAVDPDLLGELLTDAWEGKR